ncbi:MAG: arginine decarboxylase [Clostridia bacterium]|nr:arginine decarboxylase [Clostridia bacterium]
MFDRGKNWFAGKAPLLEGLLGHAAKGYCGFHTPGHKQGRGAWPPWRQLLGEQVFRLDLTELPGLDNIHDPEGIIKEAEDAAAGLFGAAETFFLVNGATAGILAVILAHARPGMRVILPRVSHQAVLHSLILSGAQPVYLPVRSHPELGLTGMATTSSLREALVSCPPGEALVVLLHPNYYGLAGEILQQVRLAHEKGCLVLVDEAHGAHFCADPLFPLPSLRAGADFVVQGAHKVLGAFTQAAFLHWRGERGDVQRVRDALGMVQSSSPSYLLMASLDVARLQCQQEKRGWGEVAVLARELRRRISSLPGLLAPGEEMLEVPGVAAWDPTRLVVNVRGLGITGFEAAEWLRRERRLLVEMADFQNLVFILGPADGGAAEKLLEALAALAGSFGNGSCRSGRYPDPLELPLPEQKMTPREAFFAPWLPVPRKEARGLVAAEVIAPYPPGVPVLCPGEVITPELTEFLEEWEAAGGTWPGRSRGFIKVVAGS